MRRLHSTIAAVGFLLFATEVPAPIFTEFPGFPNLIRESDDIVVALIVAGPEQPGVWVGSYPYKVRVLYVLKGALAPHSEETLKLRSDLVLGGGYFEVGERYLLFLRPYESKSYQVPFRGSAYRIPESTDLAKLHSNDIETNIGLLLTKDSGPKDSGREAWLRTHRLWLLGTLFGAAVTYFLVLGMRGVGPRARERSPQR